MPSFTPSTVSDSVQAQLAAQQEQWVALVGKTLEDVTRLVDLNLKLTKDLLAESAQARQKFLSAAPQELFSLAAGNVQANFNRIISYGRDVAGITSNMQVALGKTAKTQFANTCRKATTLVEEVTNSAADESKNPFWMMKSAIANASGGYEQWATMTQKISEAMDASLAMAPNLFASSTQKTNNAVRKGNSHV